MDFGVVNNKSILDLALEIQKEQGWVSPENIKKIAEIKGRPEAHVYETISFYSMIHLEAPAKVRVEVCRGTSCYIANGVDLISKISEITDCKIGECSKDGKYQLEYCECLGHCETAPNIVVNGKLYTSVSIDTVEEILKGASL